MIPPDYTIHHGEALAFLRSLPTNSVDAVVTDPPYSSGGMVRGDRMATGGDKYRGWSQNPDGSSKKPDIVYEDFTGDNRDQRGYHAWCALWLSECLRVCRPGGVLLMFTDWRQLPTTTDAIQSGGFVWRGIVVWDKGIGRPVKGRFRNHVEYVAWGSAGPMNGDENPVYPSSVFRVTPPTSTKRQHLTEKPVDLMAQLMVIIRPGGVVLDPFMGSGTTGVAALASGRTFVGCEMNDHYYAVASQRLVEAIDDGAQMVFGVEDGAA